MRLCDVCSAGMCHFWWQRFLVISSSAQDYEELLYCWQYGSFDLQTTVPSIFNYVSRQSRGNECTNLIITARERCKHVIASREGARKEDRIEDGNGKG